MQLKCDAEDIREEIVSWRRALHQIPESGLDCPKTAGYICDRLDEMGIEWKNYPGHSGVTALIGKKSGTVIGIRADMDALDVREENHLPYSSENGKMHACGHDAHTAMLLGTAKILKHYEDQLEGQVKLIFQPDEEGLSGAKEMIKSGVLENPKVDRMYAIHVGNIVANGTKPGQLFWQKGAVFASSDCFRIVVHGKGGHASTPFLSSNPILIAMQIIENLHGLVAREITYHIPSVVTITGIKGGNGAFNVIPDDVEIIGGVRTQDIAVREKLLKRMEEIVVCTADAFNAQAYFEIVSGCPPVINDAESTKRLVTAARKILPENDIIELNHSSMGGEDCSYFFTEVPGCYAFLYNTIPSDDGKEYPHHNGRFNIDDSVLYLGSAVFAQAVMDEIGGER